nr:MAG TPA: hypothetical protein [Caudoviricetes sp.]
MFNPLCSHEYTSLSVISADHSLIRRVYQK